MLAEAAAVDLRAPELALVLGERASALAEDAGAAELWVRAESLVVTARVRTGLRAMTVARAVAALRAAEDLGDDVLAAGLRTDLAICARSVGVPLTGLAALRQALDVPGCSGAARAAVLCHLVGCLFQFGRKPDLDRMLTEADRLCSADDGLDDDGKLLARALVRVAVSAHRRRHGDVMGAADAARTGLGFLEQLEDPQADGGVARVRLVLQLVCSLLDRGDTRNALEIAQPVLDEAVRAASVAPAGWLRLAVATRILLPSGAAEAAAAVLREGVRSTERHELHAITAQLWSELAHVEERLGRSAEAIECLHQARAEEHLHARARRQAVSLLSGEFGNGDHAAVDLDDVLGCAPSAAGAARPAPPEAVAEQREPEQSAPSRTVESPAAAAPPAVRQRVATEPAKGERAVEKPAVAQRETAQVATRWPAEERAAEPSAERRPSAHQRPVERTVGEAEPSTPSVARFKVAPVVALRPEADHEQRKTVAPLKPVKRPAVEPPVPAPADQPRVPLGFEALIRPQAETPGDAAETPAPRRAREESAAKPTTRHDSEHGSVAARSVLDRLGISAGGGGRRRAEPDDPPSSTSDAPTKSAEAPAEEPRASADSASPEASATGNSAPAEERRELAVEPPAPEQQAPAAAVPEPAPAEAEAETKVSMPVVNPNWLPRLKLPPSLAPFDELPADDKAADDKPPSTSETPFTNAPVIEHAGLGDPFPADRSGAPPLDDDLPPDAGLADLLARALAEHQAGTASAAALVKRFGGQSDSEARTVNGHSHHNGETPPNGRHRNGA